MNDLDYAINNLKKEASIFFQKKQWKNYYETYSKMLKFSKEKHEVLCKMGVAKFYMGEITNSINLYKDSINHKKNYETAHENLAIAYKEIGKYEDAIENFIKVLKINNKNLKSKISVIDLLKYIEPKNNKNNYILEINKKINEFGNKIKSKIENVEIKEFLKNSENVFKKKENEIFFFETQIIKKNSEDLGCKRHLKIFEEFKIIPNYCFNCYKVQILPEKVTDLIKLSFLFNNIKLKKNNIRKCMVEIRPNIVGNYKAYIYCKSVAEAEDLKNDMNNKLKIIGIDDCKVEIKHGCSEYYSIYPDFKKINSKEGKNMHYPKEWITFEEKFDERLPIRNKIDLKKFLPTNSKINLSDFLVIKNWIIYADIIGDYSYKEIYNIKIKDYFIEKMISNQIDFRKKEFTKSNNS